MRPNNPSPEGHDGVARPGASAPEAALTECDRIPLSGSRPAREPDGLTRPADAARRTHRETTPAGPPVQVSAFHESGYPSTDRAGAHLTASYPRSVLR